MIADTQAPPRFPRQAELYADFNRNTNSSNCDSW